MVNLKYLFCVPLTEEDKYSPLRERGWSSEFEGEKGEIHRLWFADILAGVTHDELNRYFSIL